MPTSRISEIDEQSTPLERFVRDYAESAGGAWEQIEPQVYDLLLPAQGPGPESERVLRLAFDPEAVAEHPDAQLATLGAPVVDQMLADAVARGRRADLYAVGLHLHPHALAERVSVALRTGPDTAKQLRRARAMQFPQALFWFETSFTSDQSEQELLCVAMDLHYGREVRHIDLLLAPGRLAEAPPEPLPEAPHQSLAAAYLGARQRAARTVGALANSRRRDLQTRVQKQSERMTRYYQQLRRELEGQPHRGPGPDDARRAQRIEALAREQHLRVAELAAKTSLRVRLRLLALLLVRQPKLLLDVELTAKNHRSAAIELVWDPLGELVEAPQCPTCGQSTYELSLERSGAIRCIQCARRTA